MHVEVKSRDWVKNAAIIFLSILLVLTFFSNTIMNRSLPEVSSQMVQSGSIVAKVRGTGTVLANGSYQEKAAQTREIRAVMIKAGQEINAGDPMFILGQGDSQELESLQEQLRSLNVSYQRASIGMPTFDYTLEENKIKAAKTAVEEAQKVVQAYENQSAAELQPVRDKLRAAQERLEAAKQVWQKYSDDYNSAFSADQQAVTEAEAALAKATQALASAEEQFRNNTDPSLNETLQQAVTQAQLELTAREAACKAARDQLAATMGSQSAEALNAAQAEVNARQSEVDGFQAELDALIASGGYASAHKAAQSQLTAAEDTLETLEYNLKQKKLSDEKTQQLAYLDLSDIGAQISKVREKINNLSGGDDNQIVAKVSGTVQSVEVNAGTTVAADTVLCTIEVPDMGYTLEFSVTNEQARRLKIGDSATVSNYYWGSEIVATLSAMKTDPKNPMTHKLLSFDLEGDVTAGSELSISVGQKGAGYDCILPSSAIKNDTNGSFVYVVEAKNSPLGNRYKAKRVDVEVLASDDTNSAVTGVENGDYVITVSNAPIKNGELVRLAES